MVEGPQALLKAQRLRILIKKRILQLFLFNKSGISSSSTSLGKESVIYYIHDIVVWEFNKKIHSYSGSTNQLNGSLAHNEMRESTLQQVDCIGKEVFLVFGRPQDNEIMFILRLHFGMSG